MKTTNSLGPLRDLSCLLLLLLVAYSALDVLDLNANLWLLVVPLQVLLPVESGWENCLEGSGKKKQ